MKKLLVLIAAALSATLVYAQDAENVGNGAQLSIIPRVDLNPYLGYNNGNEFNFSNTGLYALLEGTFADDFSYTGYFHFFDAYDFGYYYQYPFYPGEYSWLDIANLTYAPGNFAFSIGKNTMAVGTFEMEDWDHDVYYEQSSSFWNNYQVYQWGADVSYYFNDDAYAMFQVTSSPFSERTFSSGKLAYNLKLADLSHDFSYILAGNLVEMYDDCWMKMLAASAGYAFGDFSLTLDTQYRWLPYHFEDTFSLSLAYSPSEKLNFKARLNFENWKPTDGWEDNMLLNVLEPYYSENERTWGGILCEYFPLKNRDLLRLHAAVTHMPFAGQVSVNLGATLNIPITLY